MREFRRGRAAGEMSHSATAKPTARAVRALLGLGLAGTAVLLVGTYGSQPKAAAGTLTRAMHAPGATAPVAASTTIVSSHASPSTISWLAAGDSYASGAGLTKTTKLCARAPGTRADPSMAWAVVASRSKILMKDHFGVPVLVACTGAKTGEFFKSQGKSPAEWTPSMGRYDLVTFSFGGDDIGFASIIQSCYEHTSECSNGTVRSRISALGRAFPGFLIRVARSAVVSGGNVMVMGYPELIEDPSLWPQINRDTHQCQGIDPNTSKSIRGWAGALNAAIGSAVDRVNARPAAERNGVHFTFVDIVTGQSSEGISRSNPDLFEPATGVRHELCSQGDDAWLNGLTIHLSTRSMHPNQAGEDAMGASAAEVIRRLDWSHLSTGTWSSIASLVPAAYSLTGVSCVSSHFCMAVGAKSSASGENAYAFTWDGSAWAPTSAVILRSPTNVFSGWLDGVSCASQTYCLAFGMADTSGTSLAGTEVESVYEWNGRGWSDVNYPLPLDSIQAISCPTIHFCTALSDPGQFIANSGGVTAAVWNGRSWRLSLLPGLRVPGLTPLSLSCPTAEFCLMISDTDALVTDSDLFVRQYNVSYEFESSQWKAVAWPDDKVWVGPISCVGLNFCMALAAPNGSPGHPISEAGDAEFIWNGRDWSNQGVSIPDGFFGNSLACAASTFCMAGGDKEGAALNVQDASGVADVWNGQTWLNASWPVTPVGPLDSVSCASAEFCVGIGQGIAQWSPGRQP